MKIIGRDAEKEALSLFLNSKRPEFLAVYDLTLMQKRETFREETATKKALHITMTTSNGLAAKPFVTPKA